MSLSHPHFTFWGADEAGPALAASDVLRDLAARSGDRFVFDDAEAGDAAAADAWSSTVGDAGDGFDIGDGTLFADLSGSAADRAADALAGDGPAAWGRPTGDPDAGTQGSEGGRFSTVDSVLFGEFAGLEGDLSGTAPGPGFASALAPTLVYVSNQGAPGADPYNIQVEFYGDLWTSDLLDAFVASADLISSLIGQGLPSGNYIGPYDAPRGQQEVRTADDIVIEAYLTNIDGAGGVLGQAGPTYVRSSNGFTIDGLPLAGIMEFDVADAQNLLNGSLWDDTVFHEMMHVMGIGTYWDLNNQPWDGLVGDSVVLFDDRGTGTTSDDIYGYQYFGGANQYFDDYAYIPVEADGGPGTAGGHWDEEALQNEIMTGFIDNTNYLGEISVAALYDLGYTPVSDWQTIIDPYATEIDLVSGQALIA